LEAVVSFAWQLAGRERLIFPQVRGFRALDGCGASHFLVIISVNCIRWKATFDWLLPTSGKPVKSVAKVGWQKLQREAEPLAVDGRKTLG
jgi:hypothetical protein